MRIEREPEPDWEAYSADQAHPIEIYDSRGVQVGAHGLQINNIYYPAAAPGEVAPPPLVTVSGEVRFPYRGLQAFDERDAAVFFGREAAAAEVLQLLSEMLGGPGLLIISGVSGVGKSSLLRAGVISRRGGAKLADGPGGQPWPCLVMTPTSAPLDELAVRTAALAGVSAAAVRHGLEDAPGRFSLSARQAAGDSPAGRQRRLLLVVDQFEQLFTRCPDEGERQAFIRALHAAAVIPSGSARIPPALVVLVVRADFEGRCSEYAELTAAVKSRYLLTSMTEVELRLAISEPARQAGASVDDALAEELVRQARGSSVPATPRRGPADGVQALPLLSYALDQAWRCRMQGNLVGLADYVRAGGMKSIAASAEDAYASLSPGQQAAAQQIFVRMTMTSADGTVSSSRVTRSWLKTGIAASDVDAVLEAFAGERVRLMTLGADSVEISHEILLTAWRRLAGWLDGDLDDRVRYSRLAADALAWDQNARSPAYLYPAGRLAEVDAAASRWESVPGRYPRLDEVTSAFLSAARRAARARRRRLRTGIAVFSALMLAAGSAAGFAADYRSTADQQRAIALSQELAADSAADGLTDPVAAGQFAAAAWQVSPTNYAQSAMTTLLAEQQQNGVLPAGGPFSRPGAAFSPSGHVIATWGNGLKLWDVATRALLSTDWSARSYMHAQVSQAAFSADGRLLVTAEGRYARLRNPVTGKPVGRQFPANPADPGGDTTVQAVAFSPDGKVVACADSDGYIRLWDTAAGKLAARPLPPLPQNPSSLNGETTVAFSPDGRMLASTAGRWVQLWDTATGAPAANPVAAGSVGADLVTVVFSPDGKLLATAGSDGYARLWDTATGQPAGKPLHANNGPAGGIGGAVFSPDGKFLSTLGSEGGVRLWDVATGAVTAAPLPGASTLGGAGTVAYSPDGKILATATEEGTVRLWNTATWRPLGGPLQGAGPDASATAVAFSPDGRLLADAGSDGYVRLWDPATGLPAGKPLPADPGGKVLAVAFSPRGRILATGDSGGYVQLWDPATGLPAGKPLPADPSSKGGVIALSFSPDGGVLATSQTDGLVRLWSVPSGKAVGKPLPVYPIRYGYVSPVQAVFSPRGDLLATSDASGSVRLWDSATGKPVRTLAHAEDGYTMAIAFSPDGMLLAGAAGNGYLQIWDTSTGTAITRHPSGPLMWSLASTAIVFSPDGKLLASNILGQLRLWDPRTAAPVGLPVTLYSAADSVAFSSDGTMLATADGNGQVQILRTRQVQDPYDTICSEVGAPNWNTGLLGILKAKTCAGY